MVTGVLLSGMGKNKKNLGIITARGGSKSIPRKNIMPFLGKPLLGWAIGSLRESGVIDRVIVSTEDKEIADIAKAHGAEIPFMRPLELAQDHTPTLPVLQHAVSWLKEKEGYHPDCVVLLEPTSIGKRPFHVAGVVDTFFSSGADSVISVSEVPAMLNPYWQLKLNDRGMIELFTGGPIKNVIKRRQDLPKVYFRSSSIYGFKPELLFAANPSFYGDNTQGYVVEQKYALDLDTPEDWIAAELRFKKILEEEKKL